MPPLPEERSLLAQLTLPLNRCNVPAPVLASLAFQQYPVSLQLDGIETFYPELFDRLVCCRFDDLLCGSEVRHAPSPRP